MGLSASKVQWCRSKLWKAILLAATFFFCRVSHHQRPLLRCSAMFNHVLRCMINTQCYISPQTDQPALIAEKGNDGNELIENTRSTRFVSALEDLFPT